MQKDLGLLLTVIMFKQYMHVGAIFLMKENLAQAGNVDDLAGAVPNGVLCTFHFYNGLLNVRALLVPG